MQRHLETPSVAAAGRLQRCHHQTDTSAPQTLYLLCTFAILLLVGIGWAVTPIVSAGDNLILLDCYRLGHSARLVTFAHFFGFLGVAIVCKPKKRPDASMRHRRRFAMIHLLFVCAVAIASTVIGYPQGLCDPAHAASVSISGHLHQDVNYSNIVDSCSSIETSGDSAIAGFIPCEGSGGGNRGSVRSGAIVGGSCNGIEVVTLKLQHAILVTESRPFKLE